MALNNNSRSLPRKFKYRCPINPLHCTSTCSNRRDMQKHCIEDHQLNIVDIVPLECAHCKHIFACRAKYDEHQKSVHVISRDHLFECSPERCSCRYFESVRRSVANGEHLENENVAQANAQLPVVQQDELIEIPDGEDDAAAASAVDPNVQRPEEQDAMEADIPVIEISDDETDDAAANATVQLSIQQGENSNENEQPAERSTPSPPIVPPVVNESGPVGNLALANSQEQDNHPEPVYPHQNFSDVHQFGVPPQPMAPFWCPQAPMFPVSGSQSIPNNMPSSVPPQQMMVPYQCPPMAHHYPAVPNYWANGAPFQQQQVPPMIFRPDLQMATAAGASQINIVNNYHQSGPPPPYWSWQRRRGNHHRPSYRRPYSRRQHGRRYH